MAKGTPGGLDWIRLQKEKERYNTVMDSSGLYGNDDRKSLKDLAGKAKKFIKELPDDYFGYYLQGIFHSIKFIIAQDKGLSEDRKKKECEKAFFYLKLALEKNPDNDNICGNIAELYFRLDMDEPFVEWNKKALERNASNIYAIYNLGVHYGDKNIDVAAEYFRRLKQQDTLYRHKDLIFHLACFYEQKTKDFEEALKWFEIISVKEANEKETDIHQAARIHAAGIYMDKFVMLRKQNDPAAEKYVEKVRELIGKVKLYRKLLQRDRFGDDFKEEYSVFHQLIKDHSVFPSKKPLQQSQLNTLLEDILLGKNGRIAIITSEWIPRKKILDKINEPSSEWILKRKHKLSSSYLSQKLKLMVLEGKIEELKNKTPFSYRLT